MLLLLLSRHVGGPTSIVFFFALGAARIIMLRSCPLAHRYYLGTQKRTIQLVHRVVTVIVVVTIT